MISFEMFRLRTHYIRSPLNMTKAYSTVFQQSDCRLINKTELFNASAVILSEPVVILSEAEESDGLFMISFEMFRLRTHFIRSPLNMTKANVLTQIYYIIYATVLKFYMCFCHLELLLRLIC